MYRNMKQAKTSQYRSLIVYMHFEFSVEILEAWDSHGCSLRQAVLSMSYGK